MIANILPNNSESSEQALKMAEVPDAEVASLFDVTIDYVEILLEKLKAG